MDSTKSPLSVEERFALQLLNAQTLPDSTDGRGQIAVGERGRAAKAEEERAARLQRMRTTQHERLAAKPR